MDPRAAVAPAEPKPAGGGAAPADQSRADVARSRLRLLALPLVGLPLALSAYFALTASSGPVFFHAHPLAMTLAFVTAAGLATLFKKVGGLVNTRIHGYLMFGMSALAAAGGWVIWENKETFARPHLTTLHGQAGAALLLAAVPYPLLAWLLYNPDNGVKNKDPLWRTVHKWSGRSLVLGAFLLIFSGVYKLEPDPLKAAAIIGALALLLPFLVV